LLIPAFKADAAGLLSLDVRPSASSVAVGSNLVYGITVSNAQAAELSVTLTDNLPANATLVTATNSAGASTSTSNNNQVVFQVLLFPAQSANFGVVVRPTAAGSLSNNVTASIGTSIEAETNIITTVGSGGGTNTGADLSVRIVGSPTNAVVGDNVTYTITASNAGPGSASGIFVTNTFSSPVSVQNTTPTSASSSSNVLAFNVGTLASGGSSTMTVVVQPLTSGALSATASISSTNSDANTTNNSATVTTTVTGQESVLSAAKASEMNFNPQNGLVEQLVSISNGSSQAVAAARLVVSNFPFRVFNAVGTNNGAPYVLYNAPIAIGETVTLLLEYFIPQRTGVTDPTFFAFGVTATSLTAPTNGVDAAIKTTLDDRPLIEFASTPGKSYKILYSSDPSFTNALFAQPSIIAPANRTQWIDSGPPKTVSPPATRFYRVVEGP